MSASTESPAVYPIHVSVKWLPRACWIATVCLLLAHLGIWTYHYRVHEVPDYLSELFDVENEQSLENAYSSFALAMAGWLTIAMATRRRREGDRDARYWKVLGIGLLAMALEEVAGVHETINTWQGGGWTSWGMVVAALIGLWFVPFLVRLPARTRWLFLLGGAFYVGGEMVVQKFMEIYLATHRSGAGSLTAQYANAADTLGWRYMIAVKEGGTLVGVIVYRQALLDRMRAGAPTVVVGLEPGR